MLRSIVSRDKTLPNGAVISDMSGNQNMAFCLGVEVFEPIILAVQSGFRWHQPAYVGSIVKGRERVLALRKSDTDYKRREIYLDGLPGL